MPRTKQAHLDAGVEDTLYSDRFDGLWCRVLKSQSAEKSIKGGMNLFKAMMVGPQIAKAYGSSFDEGYARYARTA